MKSLVLCNNVDLQNLSIEKARLGNLDFHLSLLDIPTPEFHPEHLAFEKFVLVQKQAFSCNYRDASIIEQLYSRCVSKKESGNLSFAGFGSDYVARVIQVGGGVTSFAIDDRVVPNHSYPFKNGGLPGGIVSNYASLRYEVVHEDQLIKIPSTISEVLGATISVTGQTAYSIVKKLALKGNENILITAASSNTSIATIQALKMEHKGVQIFAGSTNSQHQEKLLKLGVSEWLNLGADFQTVQQLSQRVGGFDVVIDCFADLFLSRLINYMNFESKYITCGFYQQSERLHSNLPPSTQELRSILPQLIRKNINLIGNCLGSTEDLLLAIKHAQLGYSPVVIDSTFEEDESTEFIDRTFNDRRRFGKVVFKYKE